MNSVDRLVEYYNALVEGDWPTLVNCFDLPSKVISLYGVVNFECKEQIQNVYESVLDTWRQNGIAQEFSYKRDTFRVEMIQENINLVQTVLTITTLMATTFKISIAPILSAKRVITG